MFSFLNVPVAGAYHLVLALSNLLTPLLGTASTVAAIVCFTMLVRLLLHPLSRAAVRGERARTALAPQVNALREKHKRNPQRLNEELAKLHRESGTSMFAGCLPVLLQAPFLSVMYRLFESTTINGKPNDLLSHSLFGVTLNEHWLPVMQGSAPFLPTGLVFLALFALLAAVATYTVRWQNARLTTTTQDTPMPGGRLLRVLPYGTILIAAFLPLAAGIYLLTTNAWTAAERAWLRRPRATSDTEAKVVD
ncbi:MAG TPA: membrane protein insertase YidC [Pseudonocardiaceae bacterium]|jgi:YidC/Oxa1 family membrane protein insertase|nr:membrane protein insertase YidC [Pseudonocardiaceae bacterium]